MNLKAQRFSQGHPLYTDAWISGIDPKTKQPSKFQSTFGQMVDENGVVLCFTLERRDTLISEGTRAFKKYYSNVNKCEVIVFEDKPGSGTYNCCYEFHVANEAFQLEGCTAAGSGIDLQVPEVIGSRTAFNKVMALINGQLGTITHEILV